MRQGDAHRTAANTDGRPTPAAREETMSSGDHSAAPVDGDAPLGPELRALYEQFERADTLEERQAIWNAIVDYKRARETRVGSDAVKARDKTVEEHKRRRLWPF
jgi:hypothetical protein